MKILDIHTHHRAPRPEAVVTIDLTQESVPELLPDQAYSVGIHPWVPWESIKEEAWERLEEYAARPEVVAIGECGIDLSRNASPLFRQLEVFKRHVELSERLGKPLVIHAVKAHDIIVGLRRDLKPAQNWLVHGFRQKPEVAGTLLRAGCWLSFGEMFNEETVKACPRERLLAETDESEMPIEEIIIRISRAAGWPMMEEIVANSARFLGLGESQKDADKPIE